MRLVTTAAIAALALPSATWAQNMFVVDYTTTRTYGSTVLSSEEGTHTFSHSGYRRVDREVNGERTTEIYIPALGSDEGEKIEINHTLNVARRGPLNLPTGAPLALEPSATRSRVVPPGTAEYRSALAAQAREEGVPVEFVGLEGHGPLLLHHYRYEMPTPAGPVVVDSWRYQFEDVITEITLAETWRGTAPDGTPIAQETSVVSARRVAFDLEAFTGAIPAGMRVQNIWDRIESQSRLRR